MITTNRKIGSSFWLSWKNYGILQIAIIVVYFFVYVYLRIILRSPTYTGDDLFTAGLFHVDVWTYLAKKIPAAEVHYPPAFLLLYPIGHWVGTKNAYLLSSPYLIISAIFYWMFVKINWVEVCRLKELISDRRAAWINVIACVLITHNMTHRMHSLELRPYATLSLLFLLAFLLIRSAGFSDKFSFKYVAGIVAIALFHNFGIFMMGLSVVYILFDQLLQLRSQRYVIKMFLSSLLPLFKMVGLGFLISSAVVIWYFHYAPIFETPEELKVNAIVSYHRNTHEFIKSGIQGFQQVIALCYGFTGKEKIFRIYVFVAMFVGSLLLFTRRCWSALLFLIVLVVAPILLIYLSALYSGYWFLQRQFVWVMPFWAVYNAICIMICVQAGEHWFSNRHIANKK